MRDVAVTLVICMLPTFPLISHPHVLGNKATFTVQCYLALSRVRFCTMWVLWKLLGNKNNEDCLLS